MATWVLVDDSDQHIVYSDEWTALNNSTVNATSPDVILSEDSTIHVLLPNISTASLTYEFNGSHIALFGTTVIFNLTKEFENGLNVTLPKPAWQCSVDGTVIENGDPYGSAFPLKPYCEVDGLKSDTAHTIQLNITNNKQTSGFWFDYLRYEVPAEQLNTTPENATAWFDHTDPRLNFMGDWDPIADGLATTRTSDLEGLTNPVFFMNFNGSSVTWHGLSAAALQFGNASLPAGLHADYTLKWVIDGGTPISVESNIGNQTVPSGGNPYSEVLFIATAGTPGPHNLTVYYNGNANATEGTGIWPLSFDFLTVSEAFPNVTVDASSSSDSGTSVSGDAEKDSSKSGTIGGAVGGVLGGLLLLGLGLYLYRRWQVSQRQKKRQTLVNNLEHNNIQLQRFE